MRFPRVFALLAASLCAAVIATSSTAQDTKSSVEQGPKSGPPPEQLRGQLESKLQAMPAWLRGQGQPAKAADAPVRKREPSQAHPGLIELLKRQAAPAGEAQSAASRKARHPSSIEQTFKTEISRHIEAGRTSQGRVGKRKPMSRDDLIRLLESEAK